MSRYDCVGARSFTNGIKGAARGQIREALDLGTEGGEADRAGVEARAAEDVGEVGVSGLAIGLEVSSSMGCR